MKIHEGKLLVSGQKIAILASRFNHIVTDRLVEGARDTFLRHGGTDENLELFLVPGAFELPFILSQILKTARFNGVCVLGAIIRGGTPHFDYVSAEATKGVANVMLAHDTPVAFGILTTDSLEQAIDRAGAKAGNKGSESMRALIELVNLKI